MADTAREQAIWKTYPDYPFIEANQFGEIRTRDRYVPNGKNSKRLVKGRVLKQHDYGRGYMYIEFKTNSKKIHLSVHRIVATCFLPNPNNYPEVNHKDNNPKNNAVSNLEWCTKSYNRQYREKYGDAWGRPVFAVNLETYEVLYFRSQKEAGLKLGIDCSAIGKVVRGQLNTTGGYWFTENKNEITEEKIREIKGNIPFRGGVIAINPNAFKVSYFKSQHEAGCQLDVDPRRISDILKGRLKKSHGFLFYPANENAIEIIREKFGDEIARKVEELIRNES